MSMEQANTTKLRILSLD